LLKYDTMLGTLKNDDISADDNSIMVNGKTVKCTSATQKLALERMGN